MTIEELKEKGLILLECISGSRAYGLATPLSDTDLKGVFILPKEDFFSLNYVGQISNSSNDITYYELGTFIDFLSRNNPNILELLHTPEDCVLFKHPIMYQINKELFLSKLCKLTFGNYAMTQVKKARGLNKKILNPMEKKRKTVLEFCYVAWGQGSRPVLDFLEVRQLKQEDCGLAKVPHMHEMYALFHNTEAGYKGIVQKETANEVSLSSISHGEQPIAYMSFNKSGYSSYCKDYKEYWEWVEKRNDTRYQSTVNHGKNYDAKNMMHTFRLLNMAEEIGRQGKVNVRRTDRDYLLNIKNGVFEYDQLVEAAETKISEIENIYAESLLPEIPDFKKIKIMHVRMRDNLYINS